MAQNMRQMIVRAATLANNGEREAAVLMAIQVGEAVKGTSASMAVTDFVSQCRTAPRGVLAIYRIAAENAVHPLDRDPAAQVSIVVGFTHTDLLGGYIPMCDGYHDGAPQDVVTVTVEAREARTDMSGQAWADAAFVATNAPDEAVDSYPGARELRTALAGTRAVSVGDTVTVNGIRYVCDRLGWTQR